MSVLNQSGEEQVECPLCMEPLEVDDLNFFPCSCGYQICRFCWHRIRTDENGLCPACRKAYSENPADFTPLSKEQVAQLKAEKRQRDQQRKAKLSESRKHLANVRVVQKNLVFVVGLPLRLADAEILKRHEYFGKFGKIHKVVINQSTSYAGSQGPSASAYVTYMKSDDALRAIQNVNNISIDGRLIKSSLGTTKYCSHFMKNQPCPKPDCMYLHDFGDPKASFTKEQMHAGKHQEYERKLHDLLVTKMAIQSAQQQQQQQQQSEVRSVSKTKESTSSSASTTKDNWPQLNSEKGDKCEKKQPETVSKDKTQKAKTKLKSDCSRKPEKSKSAECTASNGKCEKSQSMEEKIQNTSKSKNELEPEKMECAIPKIPIIDDNSSFFSQNTFQKIAPEIEEDPVSDGGTEPQCQILNDSLPNINSTEDWEAAFGFSKQTTHLVEDLTKHRVGVKDTLETFGNSYPNTIDMFGNMDGYQNGFDATTNKLQENILEALSNKHSHFNHTTSPLFLKTDRINGLNHVNGVNGLDQQMSKFFSDFYKNGQKDLYTNGFTTHPMNGLSQQQSNSYLHNLTDRQNMLLMQQRQIEEQLMSLNLNRQLIHNSMHGGGGQFMNGDINGQSFGSPSSSLHNPHYQNSVGKNHSRPEDELDFDPFHETQKALAELIENEQNHKVHHPGRATNQINGMMHSQNSNRHLPPPPPGFMQSSTHMNSFGSKILPYLNMGNTQQPHQISNNSSTQQPQQQNNWSGNFSQIQQQQSNKGLGTCNDWKVLDPAIVSSSRHFMLSNMQSREQFNGMQQPTQQLQNGPVRSFDYTNYNQQMQPNYNNFSHHQNLNWLGNELNSQISSPPGFRTNSQSTKQQEC
ncbi:hypothetical protein PPYR_03282 [Photinus pyralis]|uniref:CCR4-NOT transcription complex subunit 4 n=1 Tax=Photinus pyralis TaxID=7054 RepID=A0A1Y1JR63_PHOPY|nr:CCR4-NOT transcription complex subunit 4-like isoform X1 [Photinus pyralis]XP_031330324.1 CCR4-NOT transcription complex subunit 4-like isoform X1 [Photinus pyralis]XP_031330325.1 CCR4-NOT transcription complex subunit 4-like isoform X1 [Photinus pyralis]XP_031330326.1 CCR4-NOT transcription complex subunit 4-like isoform X1 [Photinus pyralis]KAB0791482.1 hypothetical protein PPYR_03282 [Photinus pyralis]